MQEVKASTRRADEDMRYCVHLPPLRTALLLGTTAAALVAIHVLLQSVHYLWHPLPWLLRRIFDVDAEDSFPTWFSAALLLLAAGLLVLKGARQRRTGDRWAAHWRLLGMGFLLLSIDEIAGIHETINTVIPFSWAIPGLIAAVCVGLLYLPFLAKLPRRTAVFMGASALIFLAGAVGIEMATDPFFEVYGPDNLSYGLYNAAEEGMEMSGVILFIFALLEHMGGAARLEPVCEIAT